MYAVFFVLRVIFLRIVVVFLRDFREPPLLELPLLELPAEAAAAESGGLNNPNKFDNVLPLAGVCGGGGGDGELVRCCCLGGGDMLAGNSLRRGLSDRAPLASISS